MLGNYTLGFQHDTVSLNGSPYLKRWFGYILGRTVRLHKFYRGDDDRSPHSHPWPYTTFPLTGYWEQIYDENGSFVAQYTKPFLLHRRKSSHRHIVMGTHAKADKRGVKFWTPKPFWTIVFTGRKDNSWGFYPEPGKFVPWREWK